MLSEQVTQAVERIRQQWTGSPRIGFILGTGLGGLADHIEAAQTIPYNSLPHFPQTTALSHRGELVCGKLQSQDVIAMSGRFHFYEGYSAEEITFPIAVMRSLGVDTLLISNASGGMNPHFFPGQIMLIEDHLNFMWETLSPTIHEEQSGRMLSGFQQAYDRNLLQLATHLGRELSLPLAQGVYVGVTGPNYETRAEYRLFRKLGGDTVGMSTVPEVELAAQLGMKVLAFSVITNLATPDIVHETKAEEVVDTAKEAEPHLRALVFKILQAI